MSTPRHTPGPWEAHPFGDNCYEILAGDTTVCDVPEDPESADRAEHDARLIAAAPDLLRELKFVVSVLRDNHIARGLAAALEAIAKAEGRSG